MKEFDHPHVAKLVGELLRGGRYTIRWEGSLWERSSDSPG